MTLKWILLLYFVFFFLGGAYCFVDFHKKRTKEAIGTSYNILNAVGALLYFPVFMEEYLIEGSRMNDSFLRILFATAFFAHILIIFIWEKRKRSSLKKKIINLEFTVPLKVLTVVAFSTTSLIFLYGVLFNWIFKY